MGGGGVFKLASLSSSNSAPKSLDDQGIKFYIEAYEWDEEEVSSDDNGMVEVKVLMALAEDNDAVSKEGARNGEWVKISMRKHINTEILKENQNLRKELKELTKITKTWLNSSNKVNQCISEKILTQKKRIMGVDQLTEDPSSSRQKDLVFVKSSTDDTKVSIPGVERPWLSEVGGFILPNHDIGRILTAESQRNTTDPSVAVTDSLATDYDLAARCVCVLHRARALSTPHLPPLEKLTGVEPVSGPKTIKSILKSNSTFKVEVLKCVIINEPSSARTRAHALSRLQQKWLKLLKISLGSCWANDGYFLGYSLISKAFKVFNTKRQQTEETYHIIFDEIINAIKFTKPLVDNINIAESKRYQIDEYLLSYEPSQRYQTNSNNVSFIEPYESLEPVVLEAEVTTDQNGQAGQTDHNDQNDHLVQTDEILNDDQSEHTYHNNDDPIIDNFTNTKDVQNPELTSSLVDDTSDKHIDLVNIIGDPEAGMLTRAMAKEFSVALAHECLFIDFLSEEEPKKESTFRVALVSLCLAKDPKETHLSDIRQAQLECREVLNKAGPYINHILNGDIELHFILVQYQLADIFTKPLDETTFKRLIVELGGILRRLEAFVASSIGCGGSDVRIAK
ncbi:hypothetical protein Tco_0663103 [Tanacetum coccineum]